MSESRAIIPLPPSPELTTTASAQDVEALVAQINALDGRVGTLEAEAFEDKISLLVFSGDMDKLMAAFLVATGAAAMGTEVSMFFTFWGLSAVKKKRVFKGKGFFEKVLAFMLPKGPKAVPTSNMNMAGIGPKFFNFMMNKKNITSLPELIELAVELEVGMYGCQMSMDVMGIHREELLDELEICGVAGYLGQAHSARNQLFI